MPRVARLVIPNCPHHITQRGNNRQDVFFVDDDRRAYLEFLRERCETYGVRILGYCLMVNHVHLIVVPDDEDALAKAIGRTHFALHAIRQSAARPLRPPVAEPLLLLRAGRSPFVDGDGVRGAKPGQGSAGAGGVAVRVVQCGGARG